MISEHISARTLTRDAPAHLKRPPVRIQPLLARKGKPSVDVAKLAEPARRAGLALFDQYRRVVHLPPPSGSEALLTGGKPAVCLKPSPRTIAAAMATLSDRAGGSMGMVTRASARSWTWGGTPAVSRPSSRVSSGWYVKSV